MIIEVRKKAQVTIPKEVVDALNIQEGDFLEVSILDGAVRMEPVAVYTKKYMNKLEKTIMMIQENPTKYTTGPFKSVMELIEYLENDNEEPEENKSDRNQ